jgi:hypothetical protein
VNTLRPECPKTQSHGQAQPTSIIQAQNRTAQKQKQKQKAKNLKSTKEAKEKRTTKRAF